MTQQDEQTVKASYEIKNGLTAIASAIFYGLLWIAAAIVYLAGNPDIVIKVSDTNDKTVVESLSEGEE